jgi:hypothetical protein
MMTPRKSRSFGRSLVATEVCPMLSDGLFVPDNDSNE